MIDFPVAFLYVTNEYNKKEKVTPVINIIKKLLISNNANIDKLPMKRITAKGIKNLLIVVFLNDK